MNIRCTRSFLLALALTASTCQFALADKNKDGGPDDAKSKQKEGAAETAKPVDPKWLDRLDRVDRALVNDLIGYIPPAVPTNLKWIGGEARTWEQLRGKVVLIQSWTSRTSAGRGAPARIVKQLKDIESDDLVVLLLHTPDGADNLEKYLTRRELPYPTIVDAAGAYCDDLGIYKRPVNLLIDKTGEVRYAGLNARGLPLATKQLLEEKHIASKKPRERPKTIEAQPQTVEYPKFMGKVSYARDIRGDRGPELLVDKWINYKPNPTNKVVVLDFWATWCGPCVKAIPHMNDLAARFGDKVCVVGVTDESDFDFEEGLDKNDMKERDFKYALARDRKARTKNMIQITAIPHCVVLSSDWIVRWQGNPYNLSADLLDQIIKANISAMSAQRDTKRPRRWSGPKK